MTDRRTELAKRLLHLVELKKAELQLKEQDKNFIADLNESIEGCERELNFLNKNPDGVEFVNGG